MQQYISDYLKKLAEDNGGQLTPDLIVEDAKNPASPLHEEFEWDDVTAAHQHRLSQARNLIRTIHIIDHRREATIRRGVWTHDPDLPVGEQGYVTIESLKTDHERAIRALAQELSRVDSALKRAREMAMALDLTDELDQYIEDFSQMRKKITADPVPAAA